MLIRLTNTNYLAHLEMFNIRYAFHYHLLPVPGPR